MMLCKKEHLIKIAQEQMYMTRIFVIAACISTSSLKHISQQVCSGITVCMHIAFNRMSWY